MKKILLSIAAISLLSCGGRNSLMISFSEQDRLSGQTDVVELACEPIDTVDIAIIGLGPDGIDAIKRLLSVKGTRIKALSDNLPENFSMARATFKEMNKTLPAEYCGDDEWRKVCESEDIDLIYICAPKELRSAMAVYAMENGKHVATEPPAAITIDQCWELVNTAEKTRRHLIMLEKSCYDIYEMTTLNMAQQGFFGEIESIERGSSNTTLAIGPAAQVLNIHRGDKMNYLLSVSGAKNIVIKTEKGKTILVRYDTLYSQTGKAPYNISGTTALIRKTYTPDATLDSLLLAYIHPILKEFGKRDLVMDYRIIYCLKNGLPLDMDVYDAAEWSAIESLGKISAENNGQPVSIPDFTRSSWDKVKGYKQYKHDK